MSPRPELRSGRAGRARTLAVLGAFVLVTGCQDDAAPDDEQTRAPVEVADDADDPAASPDADEVEADDAPVEELEPRLPLPDVDAMELLTPAAGVGAFPTLRWEPVADAHRYHLSVIDDAGRTMWAWTTTDEQVVLGGYEQPPPEHVRGPRLHAPMHWHVLARDADERIIAQSGLRPIAP
jgi:hypothetical protein